MRRPDAFTNFKSEAMNSSSQSTEIGVDAGIDHMMKIFNCPPNRKTPAGLCKTFGVPLLALVERQNDSSVPACVKRICEYIENNGIHREGIFRVSGNSKTIEVLKASFDQVGDANLEKANDVMATAALLKLFFRELPEAVIPAVLQLSFVQAVEENADDVDECVYQLKQLVEQLPEEHFNTLRYLMAFLVRVANSEEHNRMGPNALGIVFGPSLFRVSDDLDGLQQQKLTNQIVTKFISHFPAIFEVESEVPQTSNTFRKCSAKQIVPFSQIKDVIDGGSVYSEGDGSQPSSPSQNDASATDSSEQASANSLDSSDSDISRDSSSAVSDVATEFVEMSISKRANSFAIAKLQNGVQSNGDSSVALQKVEDLNCANTVNANEKLSETNGEKTVPELCTQSGLATTDATKKETSQDVKEHIVPMRLHSTEESTNHARHVLDLAPPATPDVKRREWSFKFDDDYHELKRSMERSQVRAPLTKARRTRKSVRKSFSLDNLKEDYTDEDSMKENEDCEQVESQCKQSQKIGYRKLHSHSGEKQEGVSGTSHSVDLEPTATERPSHPFLELHPQPQSSKEWISESSSQSPSPNASRKPYVPPLDLTILHEHCDGNEPIPTNHMRTNWPLPRPSQEEDNVMVSPRTSQLKKKGSASSDPNIPPSPPVEQEAFVKMNTREDDCNHFSVKQLNKRIHNLKRKIKHFEEKFEVEYGYRPSHSEKMARSDIKKYMTELSKARKDLKQVKDDPLQAGLDRMRAAADGAASQDFQPGGSDMVAAGDDKNAMEESLSEMLQQLTVKRRVAHRPEDLGDMNKDQVHDEKVAIQKSLLHFESVFGRPKSKTEKDLMRPIYDRYRSVKRMLSKLGSPKSKDQGTELEPILEHEAMDFVQASPLHKPGEGSEENLVENVEEPCNSYTAVKEEQNDIPNLKKVKKSHNACNLHELTLPELLEQQRHVKEEKKNLRRILREFESEFQQQTGRKVQREDRTPLETTYGEYKQVKAKLRLLEALLSKHDYHYTI